MVLYVQTCDETDLPEFVRIQIAAFSTGGGMTSYMVESPPSEGYITRTIEKHVKSLREEKDVTYVKVIDTERDGQMIAGAKWRINKKERSEEEVQKMLPVPGPDEAGNLAMQDFLWYLNNVRREFMWTKPFCFLHLLVTDPEHCRRGAGTLLIRWGTFRADLDQLPSFLESSEMGRPLYEREGFTKRLETVFNLRNYGGEGEDRNTVMIRDPATPARSWDDHITRDRVQRLT